MKTIDKKAILVQGLAVQRIIELQKEYFKKNGRKITFDKIVSDLIMKANVDDLS